MEDKEDDKFTQSLGGRGFHVASAAAGGANVGRSNSIKEKKKQKGGVGGGVCNTTHPLKCED